jgi:hypothetical protein
MTTNTDIAALEVDVMKHIPVINMWDLKATIAGLEGESSMDRNRPYTGQPWTGTGERGKTEIKGITFRDLRDAFIRAFIISHPVYQRGTMIPLQPNYDLSLEAQAGTEAKLNGNDLFRLVDDCDPIAVAQNLSCEIEKLMGIFPNINKPVEKDD